MPAGILDVNDITYKHLVLAKPDVTLFILDTDASKLSIGAVLSQKITNEGSPIAYANGTLTIAER